MTRAAADVGLAFEQNSREFHALLEDWHLTLDRQNELSAYGILTLQFTPEQVRRHPAKVLALIERAYLERPTGFDRVTVVDECQIA